MGSKLPLVTHDEDVVRKAPLFTALDDAAAASLRSSMDSVKISKGSVLFAEGDEGDHQIGFALVELPVAENER